MRNQKFIILLILLLHILPSLTFGKSLDEAKKLYNQAMQMAKEERVQEAIPLIEEVLSIREKNLGPEHIEVASVLSDLAFLYELTGELKKAEPLLKRTLSIIEKRLTPNHPEMTRFLNRLSNIYILFGEYWKAEPYLKRAHAISERALGPNHLNVAVSLYNLGQLYRNLGDFQKSENYLKKAIAVLEKDFSPDHPGFLVLALNNLANLYDLLGNFGEAEALLKRSFKISKRIFDTKHPKMAHMLQGLAFHFLLLNDYGKAETYLKNAISILEKSFDPTFLNQASALNTLALLYQNLGDYPSAELLLNRAIFMVDKQWTQSPPIIGQFINNLATLYHSKGNYEKAELLHIKALRIKERVFDPNHPMVKESLNNLAFTYLEMGRFDEAYKLLKQVESSAGLGLYYMKKGNYEEAEREFLKYLQESEIRGIKDLKIAASIGLGLVSEKKGEYERAENYFRKAIDLIEEQWKSLGLSARTNFLSGKAGGLFCRIEAYEGVVRVLFKQKREGFKEDAFLYAERVKSRTFLETLAGRDLKGKTKEDKAILEKDRKFQQELLRLRERVSALEKMGPEAPLDEKERLGKELEKVAYEYETFLNEVKLRGMEVVSLIDVGIIPLEKIRSLLEPDVSLLEYYTTRHKIYAWLLTRDNINVYEIDLNEKELQKKVSDFLLPNISNRSRKAEPVITLSIGEEYKKEVSEKEREENRERFNQVSSELYKSLIAPIKNEIKTKKLIIVPHGVLHKVPFATLTDGKSFLMDNFAITILPSASVMEFIVKKRKIEKRNLLVLANPQTDHVALSYAEAEGRMLSTLFPQGEFYYWNEARETIAKKRASEFNILHFATHGEFNDRQPLQSGLFLTKDEENDGYLQVHEVFEMDLPNANLVTLSACETALSKIQGGDDLVGLSRGFIYAGTPSLLATLWKVDDASTARLMKMFYENWNNGMSKPEALRQAQIALRSLPEYQHPYYWAPFVMIGDWR